MCQSHILPICHGYNSSDLNCGSRGLLVKYAADRMLTSNTSINMIYIEQEFKSTISIIFALIILIWFVYQNFKSKNIIIFALEEPDFKY